MAEKMYPVLPVRDMVIFPHVVVPLFVSREQSIKALTEAMKKDRYVVLLTQREISEDQPSFEGLYHVGVKGCILQTIKMPDNTMKILIEGEERILAKSAVVKKDIMLVKCAPFQINPCDNLTVEAYRRALNEQFARYAKLFNGHIPADTLEAMANIENLSELCDMVASHLQLKIPDKQKLLEEVEASKQCEALLKFLEMEINVINVEKKIHSRVAKQMERSQKEYYLNEQIKAIQKELGGETPDEVSDEITDFRERAKTVKMSKEAIEKFNSELKKLRNMPSMSPEASVIRNYLDWLLSLPWQTKTQVKRDLVEAQKILDEDHYGLEKVKERVLEFLAVQNRVGKIKGSVLCFMGPPGVGKTSLAKSIAKATGRNYVKMSLGGMHDESEIRGHRRTYIGSMPGKIIAGMKKAKSSNPLFLLDEIDKVGVDWKGDPASALLEVLDPEQNCNFEDNYLEVDYDLSDVMFIATANSYKMQTPLLDRLEIIELSGYTEMEKLEIAKKYLVPKQREDNGLSPDELVITDSALIKLIRDYTREAGVRSLEREIAKLARKTVKILSEDKKKEKIVINEKNLETYAGLEKFKRLETESKNIVGVVTGLAWTEVGGELLSIESVSMPGKGQAILTGKLGNVMQESIQAAMSYVRSRSKKYGIDPKLFEKLDFHVHVPEGATPKDGPSAGVAMITSIVSTLTGIPVKKDVAMTGEITLRGRVLPIGGLKEKILAAHRGGIKTIVIPVDNRNDLKDIPEAVLKELNIVTAEIVDDVLAVALSKPLKETEESKNNKKKLNLQKKSKK